MATKLIYNKTKAASVAQHSAKPQFPMGADGKEYDRTFSDGSAEESLKKKYEEVKERNEKQIEKLKKEIDDAKFAYEQERAKRVIK